MTQSTKLPRATTMERIDLNKRAEAILHAIYPAEWPEKAHKAILAACRALAEDAAKAMREEAAKRAAESFHGDDDEWGAGYNTGREEAASAIRAIAPASVIGEK